MVHFGSDYDSPDPCIVIGCALEYGHEGTHTNVQQYQCSIDESAGLSAVSEGSIITIRAQKPGASINVFLTRESARDLAAFILEATSAEVAK